MNEKSFLQQEAYNHIKENILSGKLEPDILYSETKLSSELGISRTPVREALQCLSQDGYISIVPSRGFKIRTLSERDMEQSIQVRCAIEGYCAFKVCNELTSRKAQRLIRQLDMLLQEMEDTQNADDGHESFIQADHDFHLALVAYAENDEFDQQFQRLLYLIHLTSKRALNVSGRVEETLHEHRDFLEALRQGDTSQAYNRIIKHLTMPINLESVKG